MNYVDENGRTIADSETLSGTVGDAYTAKQKTIAGYTFKTVQGEPTGSFSDKEQTVTFVYSKNPVKAADVTVNYVDENGQTIADSETLSGIVGGSYTAQQKNYYGLYVQDRPRQSYWKLC